jgi:hypothetical protein
MTRPVSARAADAAAVRAIAQACVNVELFTIPLYLAAATSIAGMHQITGKGSDFYTGRWWPGAATTASPQTANETAYNIMFSVHVEEMLHLQLAANLASAVGVTPLFTSPVLQDEQYGWTCYDSSVIPHVVDLKDTVHSNAKVKIDGLTREQLELFLIIEESEVTSRSHITTPTKYFPTVPFDSWTEEMTEVDLPMFGTIGHMYSCYYEYLSLVYEDSLTLWDHVFVPDSQQNDLFNVENTGHPKKEYTGFRTLITTSNPAKAYSQALAMMNAITDQGEGSVLDQRSDDPSEVATQYEAAQDAMEADYPSYNDAGELTSSADTVARYTYGDWDHYDRFSQLLEMVDQVTLWPAWHKQHGPWTADDLQSTQTELSIYDTPSAADVADAMNRITASPDLMRPLFNQAAVGSLAGITTVLNQYWAQPDVIFPYPAMVGSGDRMTMSWALFGLPPDLSVGTDITIDRLRDDTPSLVEHACQGLNLTEPGNDCAAIGVYHSCRGANNCTGQGGCGFVQKTSISQTGQHGFALVKAKAADKADEYFSAPSNNICAGFGGCAVPISASQLLVQSGTMITFKDADEAAALMKFSKGEPVHEVAMRAADLDEVPPNDIRLVLPPAT